MKPFDLEAAKAGAPIVTRDGRPARFIAHVGEAQPSQRLVVLIDGGVYTKFEDGSYLGRPGRGGETGNDLFMAPTKRAVWVNLYKQRTAVWHDTEKDADDRTRGNRLGGRAWPIEIEE